MSAVPTLEKRAETGESCLIAVHGVCRCQDCDGQGSAGLLPCGRCAGSGVDPTSRLASGVERGVKTDYGDLWKWRSREWLVGVRGLTAIRRRLSTRSELST
jgi:hypothetical protein